MEVTFHFEPDCPWTWMTSRWLLRAAAAEQLEVRWAPLSLHHLNGSHPEQAAHRVVQHLDAVDDQPGIARFYAELGDRVHRHGRELSPAVVAESVEAAGLDAAALAAASDESLDAAVGERTDLAFAAAGPDVGSPILHWTDDGARDVWIFGPLLDEVPDEACAAEIWRGVRHLAVHAPFKELKRGRTGGPDLASS